MRAHLERCVQFWAPQQRDMDIMETVHYVSSSMEDHEDKGLKHLSYEEKLRGLGLFNMAKRRLRRVQ